MVDRAGGRHVEDRASRRRAGACRSRSRPSRRRRPGRGSRPAAAASRRTSIALDCTQPTGSVSSPPLWTVSRRCRKSAPARAVPRPGSRQAQGTGVPSGSCSWAPATAARGSSSSAAISASGAPGWSSASSFSSRQSSPFASRSSRVSFSALPARRSRTISRTRSPRPLTASTESSSEALSSTRTSCSTPARRGALDRLDAGEQQVARAGVDDAIGEPHARMLADARPGRRSARLHASLRPRPLRRPGAGGRRGRAGHQPVSVRARPARARLHGRRALLPARGSQRIGAAAAAAARRRARPRSCSPTAARHREPISSTTSGCRCRRSTGSCCRRSGLAPSPCTTGCRRQAAGWGGA